MSFKQLERVSLGEQIVVQLESAIRAGDYAVGDALPSERDLMQAFGVSRVAVREAMISLQVRGLVSREHGRPSRVLGTSTVADAIGQLHLSDDMSERHIREVRQTRLLIESEMARLAALAAGPKDIARIEAALETNRKAISDQEAFLASDMALHRTIGEVAGNALYVALSQAMMVWLGRARRQTVHLEGSQMLSHREHAGIVAAIAAKDPEAAVARMSEHLLRLNSAYGRLDEEDEKKPAPRRGRRKTSA